MDSQETKTLYEKGKPVQFPTKQAERILQLQKETGFTDFSESAPDELVESVPAELPKADADNGPTGNPTDNEVSQSGDAKKGGKR